MSKRCRKLLVYAYNKSNFAIGAESYWEVKKVVEVLEKEKGGTWEVIITDQVVLNRHGEIECRIEIGYSKKTRWIEDVSVGNIDSKDYGEVVIISNKVIARLGNYWKKDGISLISPWGSTLNTGEKVNLGRVSLREYMDKWDNFREVIGKSLSLKDADGSTTFDHIVNWYNHEINDLLEMVDVRDRLDVIRRMYYVMIELEERVGVCTLKELKRVCRELKLDMESELSKIKTINSGSIVTIAWHLAKVIAEKNLWRIDRLSNGIEYVNCSGCKIGEHEHIPGILDYTVRKVGLVHIGIKRTLEADSSIWISRMDNREQQDNLLRLIEDMDIDKNREIVIRDVY